MIEYFRALGDGLERAWRAQDYDEAVFAELADRALRRSPPHRAVRLEEVLDWVQTAAELPFQHDPRFSFGEPPLSVYAGARFYIQVLVWMEGTTAIHSHGFDGAFEVLAGSSVHGRYTWKATDRVTDGFHIGKLRAEQIELLRVGDRRRIHSKERLIHSLFHLDHPSATVVVRTGGDGRQFDYAPPTLGRTTFDEDLHGRARIASLRALRALDPARFWRTFRREAARMDLRTLWRAFEQLDRGAADEPEMARVLTAARTRHGARIDAIVPAMAESRRRAWLSARRAKIVDPEHRLFLAFLMTTPDRASLLTLVREHRRKAEPIETVVAWIRALAAAEGDPLDLAMGPTELRVCELVARGLDFRAVMRELAEDFDGVAEERPALRMLYDGFRRHPLLVTLCRGGRRA